ncbi:uncharacterized protein LAESUDRAFT_146476 [Laetiporus sulphureus 93-53]|uniref:BTB domain-containing protein n=1 Tax=Laetiporus sulphureus 93-53 TaxID=1314785 RepID=A0A165EB37_9APHY|nr:uncharacterized protein LAESUDRAFT_146476 [Laetiporus sulphureus 93-53]KZT06637.1 hypothetical protein LAESUDRAFT_146476 [Laetiporus sulphureus 93-53]
MATASFASSPFRRPMADIALVSSDNAKFHVHQVILNKAPPHVIHASDSSSNDGDHGLPTVLAPACATRLPTFSTFDSESSILCAIPLSQRERMRSRRWKPPRRTTSKWRRCSMLWCS